MTPEEKKLLSESIRVKHEAEMKMIAVGFVEYIRDRAWEHEYRNQKAYTLEEHYEIFTNEKL